MENGHGGSRPGAGRPKADDLDPDQRCTYERPDGSRCGNPGEPRCRFHDHGSYRSPAALEARQQTVVDKALGYPLEPVSVAEFPELAARFVATYTHDFERRRAVLEMKRADYDDPAEFDRDYMDLLALNRADANTVVKLMEAAAKLGIAASAQQVADALYSQQFTEILPKIVAALAPWPEARLAIAEALGGPLDVIDAEVIEDEAWVEEMLA